MKSLHEFWMECQYNTVRLQAAAPTSSTLFGQFAAIAYTQMKWNEEGRSKKHAQPSNVENGGDIIVRSCGMGRPNGDGGGCVRMQDGADDLQKEARYQQENKGGQSQKGCEESAAEKQAMSVLSHMRKMERGRVLYCLDYLMHRLNDEEASFRWLEDGCPDGTLEPRNILTEEQVADHADVVDSQDELDEMSALAVKILFSEMFPKAWKYLTILDPNIKRCLLEPEARCLV